MNTLAEVWFAIGVIASAHSIRPKELKEAIARLDPPHRAMTRKAVEMILAELNQTEPKASDDQVGPYNEE